MRPVFLTDYTAAQEFLFWVKFARETCDADKSSTRNFSISSGNDDIRAAQTHSSDGNEHLLTKVPHYQQEWKDNDGSTTEQPGEFAHQVKMEPSRKTMFLLLLLVTG